MCAFMLNSYEPLNNGKENGGVHFVNGNVITGTFLECRNLKHITFSCCTLEFCTDSH